MILFVHQQGLHVSLDRTRRLLGARKPQKMKFSCSITHPAASRMFEQEHASFLDENVHSSSSALLSFTHKIIAHSKLRKMAPRRDQLTLEARRTVCPGAEIH
jgi:hypothetical protein